MLQDAIHAYHDLLTDQLAADSQAMLDAQQPRRRLAFGPRPLCTALRPRFLTPQQYRFLQTRVACPSLGRVPGASCSEHACSEL